MFAQPESMSAHDRGHADRVTRIAVKIAEKENADINMVKKAAELHDIARDVPNHAIEGAKMAEEILNVQGYNEGFINGVVHCIQSHSFSSGIEPETLEAKILSDADKLDALGAIGIARTFIHSGENGRTISDTLKHFDDKLLNLKDLMRTETGKMLAEERYDFLLNFYQVLISQL